MFWFSQSWVLFQDVELAELKQDRPWQIQLVTVEGQIIETVATNRASVLQVEELCPFYDQISFWQQPWEEGKLSHPPIYEETQNTNDLASIKNLKVLEQACKSLSVNKTEIMESDNWFNV